MQRCWDSLKTTTSCTSDEELIQTVNSPLIINKFNIEYKMNAASTYSILKQGSPNNVQLAHTQK